MHRLHPAGPREKSCLSQILELPSESPLRSRRRNGGFRRVKALVACGRDYFCVPSVFGLQADGAPLGRRLGGGQWNGNQAGRSR